MLLQVGDLLKQPFLGRYLGSKASSDGIKYPAFGSIELDIECIIMIMHGCARPRAYCVSAEMAQRISLVRAASPVQSGMCLYTPPQ